MRPYALSVVFLACARSPLCTPCRRCMVLRKRRLIALSWGGVLYFREKTAVGRSGFEHRSDVVVPAHLPDPPANACYIQDQGFFVLLLSSSLSCCLQARGAETDRTKDRVQPFLIKVFMRWLSSSFSSSFDA